MREFPHHYAAVATGGPDGDVQLDSGRLAALRSAAPAEFDGPGDRWSPETLVTAALADCFVLTFRGIARFSKLSVARAEVRGVGNARPRSIA